MAAPLDRGRIPARCFASVEVQQVPQSKNDCKTAVGVTLVDDQGRKFNNRGECVSFGQS
jgi:hypothetical protein